jgi:hypothetical protein
VISRSKCTFLKKTACQAQFRGTIFCISLVVLMGIASGFDIIQNTLFYLFSSQHGVRKYALLKKAKLVVILHLAAVLPFCRMFYL